MKKFLSLVLAVVMTMSLVTVSAGAKDFTDDSKITYDEAVAVISAIGVVDGYEDGSFKPTDTLSRGAAAKIICNLILGPTTAGALSADTAPFSDVPANSTFAGYITYCSQQGIISGYADGTFRPGNTLTGYAFMKMLLGALGYDATIENYTGANWSVNVAKQALGIDLDDGYVGSFNGTKPVTREEACLFAFNTLEATMVEYDAKTSVNVSGVEVKVGGSDAKDMSQSGYKSYIVGEDKDSKTYDTLQFCEKYFEDLKKDETNDDFGRPANTWKIKSTEIGTYVDSSDLVETWTAKVTKAKLYAAVGKSVVDDLEDGDSELTYWVDGDETVVKKSDISDFMEKNNTTKINGDKDTGNGSLTEVYVDDDNNVTVVVIYTYVFQATEDYNSSKNSVKVTAAGDTKVSLDDYELDGDDFDIKDVKEDDYLLLNVSKLSSSSTKYEVQIVTAAEMISGEVDAFSKGDDVTIDGTTYEYSITADDTVDDEIQSTGGNTTLVLDQYGYVIAVDDTILGGNYVFITATDTTLSKTVKAYAYFTDGTEGEITLKKVAGSTSTSNMAKAEGWYTYSQDSAGKYTLTEVKGSYAKTEDLEMSVNYSDQILYNGRAKLEEIKNGDKTIKANEKTVFVIVDDDGDVNVYTGVSNAPDIIFAQPKTGDSTKYATTYMMGYVYKDSDSYATYVFVNVDGTSVDVDSSSEDDTFIFVTKDDKTKDDGTDTYEVYKAIVDGVETSIETDDDSYDVMKLYTKVKTDNTTERITGMKEVAVEETDETYAKIDMTDAKVTYSNGVLTIEEKDETYSFIVNKDSQLNLILNYSRGIDSADRDKTVQALMDDSGAAHEAHAKIGGSTLKSTLSGYAVSGYFYIIVEDDYKDGKGNTTLDYLFMVVNGADPINGNDDGEDENEKAEQEAAEAKAQAENLVAAYIDALDVTSVEVTSDAKKASDVRAAVMELLPESDDVTATVTVTAYTQPVNEGDVVSATVTVKATATVKEQSASASMSFNVSVELVAAP